LGKIDPRHAVKIAVGIEGDLAATTLAATGTDRTVHALLLELLEASFDLAVTGGDLLLIELDEFDGLLKRK
jgi:NAD(P)H-nitrite reductase large subunit